jgi:hypothetical protein
MTSINKAYSDIIRVNTYNGQVSMTIAEKES